jgi:antitoxin ParD1/3/4
MTVSVPPEIEQYVVEVVASGRFDSPEAVVREAFSLLQENDRRVESLRRSVKEGFDQLDRGEGIEMDEAGLRNFFDEVQARGRARYEAHQRGK